MRNWPGSSPIVTGILVSVFVVVGAQAAWSEPDPPSWTAFVSASFSGVYLSPSLETNVLTYTLLLGPSPKMTYESVTYDIDWVMAYFVVSQDPTTDFVATDNGTYPLDWKWESKNDGGRISGWHDGTQKLYPGFSTALEFGSFDITGNAVLSGLHVGYNGITGWFKDTLPVPEPASLAVIVASAALSVPLLRRRLSRR